MAAVIKHELIMHSLSHDHISSIQLFYNFPCLRKYTDEYNSFLRTNNIDPTNDTWIKELVLDKITLFIRDTELAGPATVFIWLLNLKLCMLKSLMIMASYKILMYLDLQSFYLSLLFKITLKNSRIFLNHW